MKFAASHGIGKIIERKICRPWYYFGLWGEYISFTVRYKKTMNDGRRQVYEEVINQDFQNTSYATDYSRPAFKVGVEVALSFENNKPKKMYLLHSRNLKYGIVEKIVRHEFYAVVRTSEGKVLLKCSDAQREPINGKYMELHEGQEILIDFVPTEPTIENLTQISYRIRPLHRGRFEVNKKAAFFVKCLEEIVYIQSSNDYYGRVVPCRTRKWMEPGIWSVFMEGGVVGPDPFALRPTPNDLWTKRDEFKCLGKIYDFELLDDSIKFFNVPCVFRPFIEEKQTMWNDFFGLIECNRQDFEHFHTIRPLDLVYLTVRYRGEETTVGMDPKLVDKFVEQSLRDHCSQMLQTNDITVGEYQMLKLNKNMIQFKTPPEEMHDANVKSNRNHLRITYYGEDCLKEIFMVSIIRDLKEDREDHPLVSMSGLRRNPRIKYPVEDVEIAEDATKIGFISFYSYGVQVQYVVTYMNGRSVAYDHNKKKEWMNYGVFLRMEKNDIPVNLGYICPVSSKRNEKSIVVMAIAHVTKINGKIVKYGEETIFGRIRIRETCWRYDDIEHNARIQLQSIYYKGEWIGDYDSLY